MPSEESNRCGLPRRRRVCARIRRGNAWIQELLDRRGVIGLGMDLRRGIDGRVRVACVRLRNHPRPPALRHTDSPTALLVRALDPVGHENRT